MGMCLKSNYLNSPFGPMKKTNSSRSPFWSINENRAISNQKAENHLSEMPTRQLALMTFVLD